MDSAEYAFLRRQWFPIARAEDLVPEAPLRARILDVDLVVFRSNGGVTVAGAYCPHRGMNLGLGCVVDGELECGYHGWRFGSDGRCVAIPSLPADSSPGTSRLNLHPVVERYGHIWSSVDEPEVEPPVIPELEAADEWTIKCGQPHDLPCGIRQLTENFRDVAHFPFVHWPTMGPNVMRVIPSYTVRRDGRDLIWGLPVELGGTAFDANEALAGRQDFTYHLTLPAFSRIRTSFPDGGRRYTIQAAAPLDGEGRSARQFWLVAIDRTVAEKHGVSLDEMWDYERRIFEEDWPIVSNQFPPEPPLDLKRQAHTRADTFSIKYRRTYHELMMASSKVAPGPQTEESFEIDGVEGVLGEDVDATIADR